MKIATLGHLTKGEHFQLRKNGRWYTVHAQAIEIFNDGNTGQAGDFYTIAVSGGKMFVFYYVRKVLVVARESPELVK